MSGSPGILVADKYGREVTRYQGANYGTRDMGHWWPSHGSADTAVLPELRTLTDRGRDLERNNGVAHGFSQTYVDNVVGPQLKLSATPNWRALGLDEMWADEWSTNVEAHWRTYASSLGFDLERRVNFHGMAALALRSKLSDGGMLVIPRWKRRRAGVRYSTCFQIVDIDRLCNPNHRTDTDRMRGGVEFNRDGTPIAYHVRSKHPGDYASIASGRHRWERIRAFTRWGRPKVFHGYTPTRPGQSRGVPRLASVLRKFKGLSRYNQAELNRAVAQALTTYFVKNNLGSDLMAQMFGDDSGKYYGLRSQLAGQARDMLSTATMEDNILVPLAPGDEVMDPRSSTPNDKYEPFVRYNLREIFAGLGISYEMGMRDFSNTNYSSARAAMLLDWKTFTRELTWLSTYFASLCYSTWLEEAVDKGDVAAPGFYDYREAFCACRVTGAGRGHVDPQKESRAASERLHNGTGTLDREGSEQASDWQETQDQRAREIQRAFQITETKQLPEAAAYVLAGLPIPGQFELQSPIDPDNGPGAVTETEADQAENEGIAEGREAAAETVEDEAA